MNKRRISNYSAVIIVLTVITFSAYAQFWGKKKKNSSGGGAVVVVTPSPVDSPSPSPSFSPSPSPSTTAEISPTPTPSPTPDPQLVEDVTAQLTEQLASRVTIRDAETHLFHWVKRANARLPMGATISPTSPAIREYATPMIAMFWNRLAETPVDVYGFGFYLARDPITTREYGGETNEEAAVAQIALKPGAKFMNFLDYRPKWIKADLRKKLVGLGCEDNFPGLFRKRTFTPICRQIGAEVLKRLNVDAFIYPYRHLNGTTVKIPVPGCNHLFEGAFILIHDQNVAWERSFFFVKEPLLPDSSQDAQLNRTLFSNLWSRMSDEVLAKEDKTNFEPVSLTPVDDQTVSAWVQSHYFQCQ